MAASGAARIRHRCRRLRPAAIRIEKLLTDQRVTQALDRWLGTTRSETQILYKDSVFKEDGAK